MERSTEAAADVDRINTFFPLMPQLGMRWARTRPWEDLTIAVNAHLTTLTAALLRELTLGGGSWVVCAANVHTTDAGVVELLRAQGIEVVHGRDRDNHDRHLATIAHGPELVADVGFELLGTLLSRSPDHIASVKGAVEITRTGINRLRAIRELPFGVVNINDSELKYNVENRHGVGEGLWPCLTDITGMHLSGRRVLIVGYGPVGQGVASYARARGASVEVVEIDPIRRLVANYDGFPTPSADEGLRRADIAVTVSGVPHAITVKQLRAVGSDLLLVNAGHGADEIDVTGLRAAAVRGDQLGPHCVRYQLRDKGPWLTVLGGGNPLNIVLNAGSPEPVLLHFALLGLTLEWLAKGSLPPGEVIVPRELQAEVARLALSARGHG
ncbi:MAG TPA: NAD(P)-dependent oxidoreductase [Myxococcota bacterium]|nr:NAD(P)-dependent oxidoreductase [Myxococcota bacterium]